MQVAIQFFVLYYLILWLAAAYWAFRDMQLRSDNPVLPYLAATLIVLFNVLFPFGVVVYRIIRPQEKIGEVYERNLAEEALLAEVEAIKTCPSCNRRINDEWIICPPAVPGSIASARTAGAWWGWTGRCAPGAAGTSSAGTAPRSSPPGATRPGRPQRAARRRPVAAPPRLRRAAPLTGAPGTLGALTEPARPDGPSDGGPRSLARPTSRRAPAGGSAAPDVRADGPLPGPPGLAPVQPRGPGRPRPLPGGLARNASWGSARGHLASSRPAPPPRAGCSWLGLVVLGVGAVAAGGSQAVERGRRTDLAYRGPSPVLAFIAVFVVATWSCP